MNNIVLTINVLLINIHLLNVFYRRHFSTYTEALDILIIIIFLRRHVNHLAIGLRKEGGNKYIYKGVKDDLFVLMELIYKK